MLVFQGDTKEKICSHARASYPRECCGIMLGRRLGELRITCGIISTPNIVEESRSNTQFLINPLDIVKAERLAQEQGFEIVGFYHSHPDCKAVVSDTDILHMITGYSYPIISVTHGVCSGIYSFEKIAQTDTDAEEIVIREKWYADYSVCISNVADFCES